MRALAVGGIENHAHMLISLPATLSIASYVSKGGEVLEGVGAIPDIEVIPTREALLQGKDPVCQAAIAWIRDQE